MSEKKRHQSAPSFMEALEDRTLLSAVATTTTMTESSTSLLIGQPLVLTATVSAGRRGAAGGTVEFLEGHTVMQVATVNRHGVASYDFESGNVALFVGDYSLNAKYVGTTAFAGSKTAKPARVNVTAPALTTATDGLESATIIPGTGRAKVRDGDSITVLYTGFLADNGQIFDYATANHGSGVPPYLQFTVGEGSVIPGFDQGVVGMHVGETRVLGIPSALGYGSAGSGSIPANADLVFLITVLAI